MFKTILYYTIALLIFVIIARIIAFISKPNINDSKSTIKTFDEYMSLVYCPNKNCGKYLSFPKELIFNNLNYKINHSGPEINHSINLENTLQYFNFIYNDAPRDILNIYPLSNNLSFSWPPKMGSRYKLTAFPYPKSKNIFGAVYSTISNTIDAYTFPGWSIQRRNPLDFNNSIYNHNYFRHYQDIEVIHACYLVPGKEYPFCDDGGWWLYLATGSGVFWNTGKCFTSYNKISLLVDMYNCSMKQRLEISKLNEKLSKKLPLPPILGLSVSQIVERLKGKGGGYNIAVAIFTIINSLLKHSKITPIVGFKNMKPSTFGESAWNNFISQTFIIIFLIIVVIIQFFINTRSAIKNKNPIQIFILLMTSIIIIASLLIFHFFVIFENFFRGLGWMTLDMALKETNMNLYEFVEECATGKLRNHTCNSLAMTQIFDFDIENFTFLMGYDSFILTSQPNKTGNWEVEICDIRKFNTVTESKGTIKGGICGKNLGNDNKINTTDGTGTIKKYNKFATPHFDTCQNKLIKPHISNILSSGPIKFDNTGPPYYKPTKECKCKENKNRLCTSCKNYISETLCINK